MSIADQAENLTRSIDIFDDDGRPKSQATLLLEISDQWEHFHDEDRRAYGVINDDGVRQVWPVRSDGYRHKLSWEYFKLTGKGHNRNAYLDARDTIEAKAINLGKNLKAYLRVARVGQTIYLDLCDEKWSVIEVTPKGWQILNRSPVMFIRKAGMAPLPVPKGPGNISALAGLINFDGEAGHFELLVSWMVGALRGRGPFPILVLQGEQGTGKSTLSSTLRRFIDPSTVPLRAPPRESRDLIVSAINNHLVCLDNLSGLNAELSDCLCRFATGGGLDMRKLFSDNDQVLIRIERPVLVNGIDEIASRPDLSERAVKLHLPVIQSDFRKTHAKIGEELYLKAPEIMGGILDALSTALANEPTTKLDRLPRMADFAVWASAAEPAMPWSSGAFMRSYTSMQLRAIEDGVDSSPVTSTLVEYLRSKAPEVHWSVTPTHLLGTLTNFSGIKAKSRSWPQSPRALGNTLKRFAPSLRALGISFTKDETHQRMYHFTVHSPEDTPQAHKVPQARDGGTSSVCASGADSDGCADTSVHKKEAHSDAHTIKPTDEGPSGGWGASGANSGQCTTDHDPEFDGAFDFTMAAVSRGFADQDHPKSETIPDKVQCKACVNAIATPHPMLVDCVANVIPHGSAGHWKTDKRYCLYFNGIESVLEVRNDSIT